MTHICALTVLNSVLPLIELGGGKVGHSDARFAAGKGSALPRACKVDLNEAEIVWLDE
jgi:hypothetical protein